MGTTADKLNKLVQTKAAIKTAIEAKGQTVGDIPFSQYPAKINAIEGGGEGSGTIEDYLNSVGKGYLIDDVLYVLTRSVEGQDNTKTLYYLAADNNNGGMLFVDGCLPPATNQGVNYQKPLMSVKNVDFSTFSYTANNGRIFAYNGNLVEFSGVSTDASGDGITDFSEVVQSNLMFSGCASLREVKVYLPKAINLDSAFSDCFKIMNVTVKGVTAAVSTSYMFNKCYELTDVTFIGDIISTNARGMFAFCEKLTTVNGVIDVTGLTNLGQILDGQGAKNIREIRLKGVSDSIAIVSPTISRESLLYLFNNAVTTSGKTIMLSTAVYDSLTADERAIITDKGFILRGGATA